MLHTKGLVGDDYRIIGSMNFTFFGIEINDEAIHFDQDIEAVVQTRLEFEQQYGDQDV
jgi:phosphatidylserine/phosphatidylglycerophosphate/cardiolipin synthase-like enzyme